MARPPEICPHCGTEVPAKAKACPQCGADEKTGWSEEAQSGDLDLPGEDFDYDDHVQREFGQEVKPRGLHWFWWLVAILLLLALLMVFIR